MTLTRHRSADGDRPLPHSMTRELAGWSSRARQYPVFSRTWFAYRMRSFIAPLAVLALVLAFAAMLAQPNAAAPAYVSLSSSWLVVVLAVALGRALAVLVCRRNWAPAAEAAGVVCAILFGAVVALSLLPFARQPDQAQAHATQARQPEWANKNNLVNLTVWFAVLLWLGGALDLIAYFRQRGMLREATLIEQMERYKDERDEVEMRLAVLSSQIEPHFLFNTLSGVRASMQSDPARGIVMIDHLVDYLRSTIPQLREERTHRFVELGTQLDSVAAYLGIIEARLPRLFFSIDCPAELRRVAVPPLMLISLVENAVKHGIELKKGPAEIRVTARHIDEQGVDMLTLTVADNGVGFGAVTSGSGIGLANIRERLRHLYDGAASLSMHAGETGGVVACIAVPMRVAQAGQ
jgi:signal transduction histidine kinase